MERADSCQGEQKTIREAAGQSLGTSALPTLHLGILGENSGTVCAKCVAEVCPTHGTLHLLSLL